jgi:hypothetical protein
MRYDISAQWHSVEGRGLGMTENVTEFPAPGGKPLQVSLTFSGDAGTSMRRLMANLGVDSPNEVAIRAIALLLSAQGKEVLLRDPKTGVSEVFDY